MQTFAVQDLEYKEAYDALKKLRQETIGQARVESDEVIKEAALVSGMRIEKRHP
jgi:hypothetical protein